jgi:hypothetical protein
VIFGGNGLEDFQARLIRQGLRYFLDLRTVHSQVSV